MRVRNALVGAATLGLVAALMPAALPAVADDSTLSAAAEWDDSLGTWLREDYFGPCSAFPDVDVCIEDAWITSASGERMPGAPILVGVGWSWPTGAGGWLYEFPTPEGPITLGIGMSVGQATEDGYVAASVNVLRLEPRPLRFDGPGACPYRIEIESAWCAIPLPPDMRFGMTLRSALPFGGWMNGRLTEPRVEVLPPLGAAEGRVTVEATVTRLPTLRAEFRYDDPQDRADWSRLVQLNENCLDMSCLLGVEDWKRPDGTSGFLWAAFPAIAPLMFNKLAKELAPRLDRATGWVDVWRFDTYFVVKGSWVDKCAGNFNGLTSSNALTYQRELNWDPFTRELTFTMAGPTYTADGERNRGDFHLVMTEAAAQCLWGDARPTDRLQLQVSTEDGVDVVATASVTRKDGQIQVRATGFGFSLKNASLTQVAKGAPATPSRVKARVRGSALRVTWAAKGKLDYRVRVSTGEAGSRRVVQQVSVRQASAEFTSLRRGSYLGEIVAANAKGQSRPARTTVRIL